MHVHASTLDFLIVSAYVIVLMFLLRLAAAKFYDRSLGKAIAFIH